MKRIKLRHLILALAVLATGSLDAYAASSCKTIFTPKIVKPFRMLESSVEIETSAELINSFMTTTDGTLRPIVGHAGIDALPEAMLKDIRESFPEMDPLDMDWDLLTSQEKKNLIMHSAQQRGQEFFKSRTIPGLKYREQIKISFAKPSRFMGKDYRAGTYTFNTKDIFRSTAIEFMGPTRMTENLGIEIHLRSALGADENYISARSFQAATTGRIRNVHQHVVARLPIKRMSEDPERMAFTLTEFVRRQMMKAQFAKLRDAQPVELIKDDAGNHNMPLTERSDFSNLFSHFLTLGKNLETTVTHIQETKASNEARKNSVWNRLLQTNLAKKMGLKPLSPAEIRPEIKGTTTFSEKMGLIGVRSYDLYDGSRWKWGIEFRDLSPNRDVPEQMTRLKTAQTRMITQDYEINFSNMDGWLRQGNLSRSAGELYFPDQNSFLNPTADLAKNFPHIEVLKDAALAQAVKAACQKNKYNTALNVLFHDWAKDPIVDGDSALIQQVESVQKLALIRLSKGESSNTVMQYFVKKSGLDYRLAQL